MTCRHSQKRGHVCNGAPASCVQWCPSNMWGMCTVTMLPKMTLRLRSSESMFTRSLAARALATSMSSAERCTTGTTVVSHLTLCRKCTHGADHMLLLQSRFQAWCAELQGVVRLSLVRVCPED